MKKAPVGSVRKRLVHGLGAQAYGQAVQILIRLTEVPLLLHFWGVQRYGEWLMLSAIPVYLAIADGGFAGAASREMSMRSGAGDRAGALAIFQSTAILLVLVSAAVIAVAAPLVWFAPLDVWLGFREIGAKELRIILLLLLLHVLVGFQGGLLNGGFWCSGRYPLGMLLSATTEVIEFTALAVAVVLGGGPAAAAAAFVGGRIGGTLLMRMALRRATPWLGYGCRSASFAVVRRLLAPAVASLAFPLGNVLNIQGMRLVVGLTMGPAAVAVFAPLRTLGNLVVQFRAVINRLIQPELALAFGKNDRHLIRRLFLRSAQVALWSCGAAAVALAGAGQSVLAHWTGGKVAMEWPLFVTLLAAGMVNGVWYTALMVPYATNQHGRIAVVYAALYGAGAVVLAYLLARTLGLRGIGMSLLVAEVLMAGYVLPRALCMAGSSAREWLAAVARPPSVGFLWTIVALRGYGGK